MQVNRIVVVLACLCPLAPAQTDAGLWRFVHPNAKALVGIDVQRIRSSKAFSEMSSQFNSMPLPLGLPTQWPVMDLVRSVDRVIVSSPGKSADDPSKEPPLLIAISGHFEPGKLKSLFLKAGAKQQVFNSVTIYRLQDKASSEFGFVVLNSQTLLAGDAKSLYTVIERLEKGNVTPPPIVEKARDMDVAYDFWAILLTPPSAMASERFASMDMAGKLNGFQFGVAVRDGMALDVNLNATSEAAAKEMMAQLSKLMKLASKDRENHPEWAGLDKKMKLTVEHSDVHFAFRLNAMELVHFVKAMEESNAKGRARAAQAASSAHPTMIQPPGNVQQQAKPNPPKQVIRIEGLDGGTREIPYQP